MLRMHDYDGSCWNHDQYTSAGDGLMARKSKRYLDKEAETSAPLVTCYRTPHIHF